MVQLPSVAAIFSGALHRGVDDFATAPLVSLDSPYTCSPTQGFICLWIRLQRVGCLRVTPCNVLLSSARGRSLLFFFHEIRWFQATDTILPRASINGDSSALSKPEFARKPVELHFSIAVVSLLEHALEGLVKDCV